MSKKVRIASFERDKDNFNLHTEKGMDLLGKSVEEVGILEAITISEDGVVISGNARHEVIGEKFKNVEPIVVETDGQTPVIIKRKDISSGTADLIEILNTVSNVTGIPADEIKGKNRKEEVVIIRQIFCHLCRKKTAATYDSIGRLINRDHATAFHSSKQVEDYLKTNDSVVMPIYKLITEELLK